MRKLLDIYHNYGLSLKEHYVRWFGGGRMPDCPNPRRAKARPVKADKPHYERRRDEGKANPQTAQSDALIPGLAHLAAPESLEEAVRLAKERRNPWESTLKLAFSFERGEISEAEFDGRFEERRRIHALVGDPI